MFRPTSLKLPSPSSIAKRALSSAAYLFIAGVIAAGAVVSLDGGFCHFSPTASPYMCDAATLGERGHIAIIIMSLYSLYVLLGPAHNNHDHMLIFSHETSWIHAISNWLSKLAAGINPLTSNIGDFMNAAADTNTRYQRHNILTFLYVVFAIILFLLVILGPWTMAYYAYPQSSLVPVMLAVLAALSFLIALAFGMIGLGILKEKKHTHHESDG